MTYDTPAAFRAALEARLANDARDRRVDLGRLRRRVAVERLLVRLASTRDGRWIVKGGMALEMRLRDRARATRDLDLAIEDNAQNAADVHERLATAAALDPHGDGFEFRIGEQRPITEDEAGRPGWRFSVEARLAGRTFERVRLDVVARTEEITATELVRLPGTLAFAGFPTVDIEVIDRAQHFAEKLHALTRDYGDRPNSRVWDLVDLVLLIDDGLTPSSHLAATVDRVFRTRATHDLPESLPDPPIGWRDRYAELAADLDVSATTIDDAMRVLRSFWAATLTAREDH